MGMKCARHDYTLPARSYSLRETLATKEPTRVNCRWFDRLPAAGMNHGPAKWACIERRIENMLNPPLPHNSSHVPNGGTVADATRLTQRDHYTSNALRLGGRPTMRTPVLGYLCFLLLSIHLALRCAAGPEPPHRPARRRSLLASPPDEEVQWDYTPSGRDEAMGMEFDEIGRPLPNPGLIALATCTRRRFIGKTPTQPSRTQAACS